VAASKSHHCANTNVASNFIIEIRPMIKTFIWTLLVTSTLTACRPESRKEQTDNGQDQLTYDTTKTAIISWDRTFNYPFDSINYQATMVTQDDINQIDSLLISSVTEYNNSLADGHEDYKIDFKSKDYKKQLLAVINSKGEKEIWVNCFCDDWDKSWTREILIVHDGGPCYFNFKINLTRKKVFDFAVNGFA
jgi:hypothetical protein